MKDLRNMIESELLPGLEETGLRIISQYGSPRGMGQGVDLRAGNLKIQVLRDKQHYEVFSALLRTRLSGSIGQRYRNISGKSRPASRLQTQTR